MKQFGREMNIGKKDQDEELIPEDSGDNVRTPRNTILSVEPLQSFPCKIDPQ